MFRAFTASALAAVMAVTPMFSTPAEASNRDLHRFIAGVGTVLIIGSILDSRRGHTTVITPPVTRPYRPHRPVVTPPAPHRPVVTPAPSRPQVRRHQNVLPAACLNSIRTHTSVFEFVERRCLAQRAPRVSLPDNCLRRVEGRNRNFTAYGATCLRRSGFSI